MTKFLLWCILFVLCWPIAILALIAYPVLWLILLPYLAFELLYEAPCTGTLCRMLMSSRGGKDA